MKDWKYYHVPVGFDKSTHVMREAYRKPLLAPIREMRLTESERIAAIAEVDKQVVAHFDELDRPYYDEKARLRDEFWRDAREELGYTKYLSENAVKLVETQAEELTSESYRDIFASLYDTLEFVRAIVKSCRADWESGKLPWPEGELS